MTDTKTPNEAELFRPIPLNVYFQDFKGMNQYHYHGDAPYMRPTFYNVEFTLGLYDTEYLIGDLAKAVGMPNAEADEIIQKFRPYVAKFAGPETPPEF